MDDSAPMVPKSADLTAVAEWVAEVVRDRIIKGVLAPGDRIVERRLSAELDVSRTPIREALKLLSADHLITISRNKGAVVTAYSAEQAVALFDVIASLESLAAERVAATITDANLEVLEEMHDRMVTFYKIRNADYYFEVNSEIHEAILELSGNPILREMHTKLMARARRGRFMAIMNPDRLDEAVQEHEVLMTALRARDDPGAREIWRNHLLNTGRTVAGLLQNETPD